MLRALIAYYTMSGNTERAATAIGSMLSSAGVEVEFDRIIPLKDESYLKSALGAILRKEVPILNTNLDVSSFDIIIVGSPVWILSTAPQVNSYLEDIGGIEGKKAAAFVTMSGVGGEWAVKRMQYKFTKKKAKFASGCKLSKGKFASNAVLKSAVNDFVKTILK